MIKTISLVGAGMHLCLLEINLNILFFNYTYYF